MSGVTTVIIASSSFRCVSKLQAGVCRNLSTCRTKGSLAIRLNMSVHNDKRRGVQCNRTICRTLGSCYEDNNFSRGAVIVNNIHRDRCRACCMSGKAVLFVKVFLKTLFLVKATVVVCCGRVSRNCRSRKEFRVVRGMNVDHERIGKTVHERVLLMFFVPLIVTVIRVSVTFPLVHQLLLLFKVTGAGLCINYATKAILTFTLICKLVCSVATESCCGVIRGTWGQ